jgi:hypothetical protein
MSYSPSNYDAVRDGNRVPVAMGQSNTDATQTLPFKIDSITGRLLVDSSSGTTSVYNEPVSGSATTWTLAHTPTTGSERIYANGQRLTPTTDYSISGATVTTVLSWSAGTLLADYTY